MTILTIFWNFVKAILIVRATGLYIVNVIQVLEIMVIFGALDSVWVIVVD